MANVKPLPDGYHNVTPYLFLRDAGKAIEFYKNVFSAGEKMRMKFFSQSSIATIRPSMRRPVSVKTVFSFSYQGDMHSFLLWKAA